VAIANALQLEAARATPALSALIIRRHAKFDVAEPIHCRIIAFLLLKHYFTPWIWAKSNNPRRVIDYLARFRVQFLGVGHNWQSFLRDG